jgi:Baseplate J-like protein
MATEIPKVILDPQNEDQLVQLAYNRIREASNGTLNDFRAGSPLAALIEGQMFGVAELLFYLNILPEALALEVFRLSGVARDGGTKATGSLTFLLQAPLAADFLISSGYAVPYKDSFYVLSESLYIPAGAIEATVNVISAKAGTEYNAAPYSVLVNQTGINYLQTIYNPGFITGGSEVESLESTVSRAQQVLRDRQVLVSATDYELAAQAELGDNSRALCIPFLSSDKLTTKVGQVHLFLCDPGGNPAPLSTCESVKLALSSRIFAASQLWVSPVNLDPITVQINLGVTQVSEALADSITEAVYDYLSPLNYQWGLKLRTNEIAYVVRAVTGVNDVDSVFINDQPIDYLLPNKYTTVFIDTLEINLIQEDGVSQTYIRGLGEGDLD